MYKRLCRIAVGGGPLCRHGSLSVPRCSNLRCSLSSQWAAPMLLTPTLGALNSGLARLPTSGAACAAQRRKATYGKPSSSQDTRRARKPRKNYNYLTTSRLIETPKKLSVKRQRRLDDRTLARRNRFKEKLLQDVEEKIRFFPPVIKRCVFFPLSKSNNRAILFRGHRDLGAALMTRVLCLVIEQLKKAENRPFLVEKMKELDVEPPTAAEWKKFTDAKTGDINIGILYSPWVETILRAFAKSERVPPTRQKLIRSLRALHNFVVKNATDPTRVPPLEEWARARGPVLETDFIGRACNNIAQHVQNKASVLMIQEWGKQHAFGAVSALSLEEQLALVKDVAQNSKQLLQELEERHLFTTKFKQVLYSLDEVKAITTPRELFRSDFVRKFVIKHNGAYYPKCMFDAKTFTVLRRDEKARLCAFGYRYESYPTTGQKLYLRYCLRDYGMSVSEAARRYGRLSDLQRAALCFPFYLPIAPRRVEVAAFRRFYDEMCGRYGLINPTGPVVGSRLFEAAMRKRWRSLSIAEREKYEESDRSADVFPLIKPAAGESLSAPPSTAAMAEYFTEDHPRKSSGLDEQVSSAATEEEKAEGTSEDYDAEPRVATTAKVKTPRTSETFSTRSHAASAVARAAARGDNGREAEWPEHHEGLRVIVM
ncbi:hypothetical protein ABL78_6052 [Leptomonas seymouri]|uniref:Uncharacterized protein n=1 Tax=Leptomonas seymouri TaxID=5684 RepID=A0A0N0P4J5_LEPSE|nr:hypothetical protein ABL78_6052 [Leptomonas seymouri]|eukprot:KPI84897.1 hypothetical protein ABL78_6052 [Leptomonas seymouri]